MAKKNAFEELLESIPDEGDRKALEEIGGKYQVVRDGHLRQSDYSRKMDELAAKTKELQAKLDEATRWNEWAGENYVYDAYGEGKGATKRELEQVKLAEQYRAQMEELQQRISEGGEVNFDDVKKHIDGMGFVKGEEFQTQAKQFQEQVYGTVGNAISAVTALPALTLRHFKEFGEVLDEDTLFKHANEKGLPLKSAYDDFVHQRRDEARQKEIDERIAKAAAEAEAKGRAEALKERGMSPGSMPVDSGESQVGPLGQLIQGAKQEEGTPDIDIGRGGLARHAARTMERPA